MNSNTYHFRHFDPKIDVVDNSRIPSIRNIMTRARSLLEHRSSWEIQVAVDNALWFVSEYRSRRDQTRFQEQEADTDEDPAEQDLADSPDLEVLKQCIELYDLGSDSGFPNGSDYEYFASWAIYRVSSAFDAYLKDWPLVPADTPSFAMSVGEARVYVASDLAMEAMAAVCYAEHLRELSRLSAHFRTVVVIKEVKEKLKIEKRSAALIGRAEDRAMKADVWAWCDKNLSHYKNSTVAAKAALEQKLVIVKLSTLKSWIREYKRDKSAC